jgi:arginine/lysine/ornithine decarboxylase
MASEKYVIAMTSIGDTDEGYVRFIQALRNLDVEEFAYDKLKKSKNVVENENSNSANSAGSSDVKKYMNEINNAEHPQISISIFDALNSETEEVPLESSAGHVAGAALCIYPPGINLVNPGEIITKNVVEILKSGMKHGLEVLGVDTELMVKVISEEGKWRKLHL